MHYNDPQNPSQKTRMLRRVWKCTVFKGNPDAKKPKTTTETVIAWNAVEANRKMGRQLACEPESLGWVTWPRAQEDYVYFIENPSDGPIEKHKVRPSVGGVADEDDWDF